MNKRLPIAMQTAICLCCGKAHKDDTAILLGTQFKTEETAERLEKEMYEPSTYQDCEACTKYKEQGVILVGYDEEKSDLTKMPTHAFRTGEFLVVTVEGVKKLPIPEEFINQAIKKRILFIPTQLAQQLIPNG